jgi:hypothetical protein
MNRWLFLLTSLLALGLLVSPSISNSAPSSALPKSRFVRLFDGKVRLTLPRLAADPVALSDKLAVIQPQLDRPDLKYIIYVTRETLRPDVTGLSNKLLNESVKKTLQGIGLQVIGMVNSRNTFVVDFRAPMDSGVLPWQKVGPGMARGTAKFVRTGSELSGALLLCDPSQWGDETTQIFRKVIGGTVVAAN